MSALNWVRSPSADQAGQEAPPLYRVPTGGKALVIPLEPFRAIWTHYVRGRTFECKSPNPCPYCGKFKIRLKLYASALVWYKLPEQQQNAWNRVCMELTENCQRLNFDESVVGTCMECERVGKGSTGRVVYRPGPDHLQPDRKKLPEKHDITQRLLKLWDDPERHLQPLGPPAACDVEGEILSEPPSRLTMLNGHANGKGGVH